MASLSFSTRLVQSAKLHAAALALLVVASATAGCLNMPEDTPETQPTNTDPPEGTQSPDNNQETSADQDGQTGPENGSDEGTQNETGQDNDKASGEQEDDDKQPDDPPGDDENNGGSGGEEEDTNETGPAWPGLEEADLRPGLRIHYTQQLPQDQELPLSCTTNFLFVSPTGELYLGTTASCVSAYLVGQSVPFGDGEATGTLAYSGQWNGQEHDSDHGHDFAMIEIPDTLRQQVHPAVLHYGGPVGLGSPDALAPLDPIMWYGNSTNTQSLPPNAKEGYTCRNGPENILLHPVAIALPGDRGAGIMDADGNAIAILNETGIMDEECGGVIGAVPLPSALEEAHQRGFPVELATWELLQSGHLPTLPET
jgi:hypothetical protein